MKNLKKLSRGEMKSITGGTCNISVSCGASITNCNGTCSSSGNTVTCTGPTKSLSKSCTGFAESPGFSTDIN